MVGIPPKTFENAHSMMDELIQQNNTQQDTTKGFMDKTFTEAFIKEPWLANAWQDFKKPWLMDLMKSTLGEGAVEAIGNWAVPPKQKQQGEPFLDFTGIEGLSRGDIEEAWSDLPTLGRFTKWKGGTGKKYVDLPTPTRLDKHTHFPIERLSEFMKLVDMYGLPDKKGKFYEPQTIMRNE